MRAELSVLADLRLSVSLPVDDQGMRPVCAPFAVTAAHEVVRSTSHIPTRLSSEALWTYAWERNLAWPGQTGGTSLEAMASALEDHGQPEFERWPFDALLVEASPVPVRAGVPPWMRARLSPERLDRHCIMEELLQGRPVVLAVHVTNEFIYADRTTGRIEVPPTQAEKLGLHAVLCMGTARDSVQDHFLIRNSWGTSWGLNGHGWLPGDYVDRYGHQMGLIGDLLD